jgi:hypothetical protein
VCVCVCVRACLRMCVGGREAVREEGRDSGRERGRDIEIVRQRGVDFQPCLLQSLGTSDDDFAGPEYRVQHMAMMALEAKRWVENHHPWWKRRGGADHIWLFTHDEAPCWVPEEIYNTSIILSHWGRKV